MSRVEEDSVVHSSGNVLAVLGPPSPEERGLKARLASRIHDDVETRGWTQVEAAEWLGLSQPDVSRLMRGVLNSFSIERLMGLLDALDYRVSIHIEGGNQAR